VVRSLTTPRIISQSLVRILEVTLNLTTILQIAKKVLKAIMQNDTTSSSWYLVDGLSRSAILMAYLATGAYLRLKDE
jgi:hypothetical protein